MEKSNPQIHQYIDGLTSVDQIIDPRHANAMPDPTYTNTIIPTPIINNELATVAKIRQSKINELRTKLQIINSVCEPICEFLNFHNSMNPEIRAVVDINHWMFLIYGLKAVVKELIDVEYLDIVEPPVPLKESMKKAYSNLNSVSDGFKSSMEEISLLLQDKLLHCATKSPDKSKEILVNMNKSDENILPK